MIFYASVAVLLLVLSRSFLGRGYAPGQVWAYVWALAWASQAVLGWGFAVDGGTAKFVAICNLTFLIGAWIASPQGRRTSPDRSAFAARRRELEAGWAFRTAACVACLALGVVALNVGLKQIGHPGLTSLFSGTFIDFGRSLVATKSRFSDEGVWVGSAGLSAASALATSSAVLAGIESAIARPGTRTLVAGLSLSLGAFAFLFSAATGVRSYLLATIVVYAAAFLAAKAFVAGDTFTITRRAFGIGFAVIAFFLVWTVVVQSARRHDYTFERLADTFNYLRAWFAGYLPALSQWISTADVGSHAAQDGVAGSNLLRGLLTPLGLQQGAGFTEQIPAVPIGNGATSNAMTLFRVLLLDFGYAGTIAVCAVGGYVSQRTYIRAANGSSWALLPLAAIYAALLYSINYWFFAYGSRVAGFGLAVLVAIVGKFIVLVGKRGTTTPFAHKRGRHKVEAV